MHQLLLVRTMLVALLLTKNKPVKVKLSTRFIIYAQTKCKKNELEQLGDVFLQLWINKCHQSFLFAIQLCIIWFPIYIYIYKASLIFQLAVLL